MKKAYLISITVGVSFGYLLVDAFTVYKKGMFVIIMLLIALLVNLFWVDKN